MYIHIRTDLGAPVAVVPVVDGGLPVNRKGEGGLHHINQGVVSIFMGSVV